MKRYEKLIRDPIAREEAALALWDRDDVFRASLRQTKGRPSYVFFEGPPTANGRPHFGHLMPRVYKDLYPRYKTMQGFYVGRKGGWDTHGLPVELEVEKEIGVNSKPEIEAFGVERFVALCKESVMRYKADWEGMMRRMGFWVDLENAYVTYTDEYIESVWWELKTMFDRGLLYNGHKTLPYCPALRHRPFVPRGRAGVPYRRRPVDHDSDADRGRRRRRVPLRAGRSGPPFSPGRQRRGRSPANVALAVAADAAVRRGRAGRRAVRPGQGVRSTRRSGASTAGSGVPRRGPRGPALRAAVPPDRRARRRTVSTSRGSSTWRTERASSTSRARSVRTTTAWVRKWDCRSCSPSTSRGTSPRSLRCVPERSSRTPTRRLSPTCASAAFSFARRRVRARVPVLLALRHTPSVLRDGLVVHPDDGVQRGDDREQRHGPLASRSCRRRASRRLPREPQGLGAVARPVLGHAAEPVDLRGMR